MHDQNSIFRLFRKVTPEELEIKSRLSALTREIREMEKEMRAEKLRLKRKMQAQQAPGYQFQDAEISVTPELIEQRRLERMKAIKIKKQKAAALQITCKKVSDAVSRQQNLF